MNKKGFTLIELMMVIALIAVLSLILVPNVVTLIKKNNIESCHNIEKNIINATKMYVTENKYDLGFSCDSSKNITLATLVASGDLKSLGKNPVTKEDISPTDKVIVTYDCNTREFTYTFSLSCES